MDIAGMGQRYAAKGMQIAQSVLTAATFELVPQLGSLNPATESFTEGALVKKQTSVLSYRDKWDRNPNGNLHTEMLLVLAWHDGTPVPSVNDVVNFSGMSRRIASISPDPSNAIWQIELVAPTAFNAA